MVFLHTSIYRINMNQMLQWEDFDSGFVRSYYGCGKNGHRTYKSLDKCFFTWSSKGTNRQKNKEISSRRMKVHSSKYRGISNSLVGESSTFLLHLQPCCVERVLNWLVFFSWVETTKRIWFVHSPMRIHASLCFSSSLSRERVAHMHVDLDIMFAPVSGHL